MQLTNTAQSFSDKWQHHQDLAFSETLRPGSDIFDWILQRNGFQDANGFAAFLHGKTRILDAGCGNGRVTALLREHSNPAATAIVAIDLVAAAIAQKNLAHYQHITVLTHDLLADLSDLGTFDFIYCQEVLHHTADPRRAFLNLCSCLQNGGDIAIYVYKKKAPVREFVDDYIRNKIAALPYAEAMHVCEQITHIGQKLSELHGKITIPAVDLLEIPAGEYDVQRFFYHFFMKCFWNDHLAFSDNAAINYDWYHPDQCSRHTREEVREWFDAAGLTIAHETVDEYGITMRGHKAASST